jgi:predicted acylesterase/phospholipase RssA
MDRRRAPLTPSGVPNAAQPAPRIASGALRVRSASRRLIDGGVVNGTPISRAVELGAERISILPTQG